MNLSTAEDVSAPEESLDQYEDEDMAMTQAEVITKCPITGGS